MADNPEGQAQPGASPPGTGTGPSPPATGGGTGPSATDPTGTSGPAASDLDGLRKQVEALTKRIDETRQVATARQQKIEALEAEVTAARQAREEAQLSAAEQRKAKEARATAIEARLKRAEARGVANEVLKQAVAAVTAADETKAVDEQRLASFVTEFLGNDGLASLLTEDEVQVAQDAAGNVSVAVTTAGRERMAEKAKRIAALAVQERGKAPTPPKPGGTAPTTGAGSPLPAIVPTWAADSQPGMSTGKTEIEEAARKHKDVLDQL